MLNAVSSRGLTLRLDGKDLRLEGPQSQIDPALVASIRAVKAEAVAHLAALRPERPTVVSSRWASTPMQQSYFYGRLDHFALGNVASHVYHEIEGSFAADRLERALAKVVERHGALRTIFHDDVTQTELNNPPPPRIAVSDLRKAQAAPAGADAARLATRAAMSHQILRADQAPLIDVRLTILSDTNMVLHVSHDGLIMDGISSFLFFRDWWRFYQEPDRPVAPLEVSFRDYVEALETRVGMREANRARTYWLGRLDQIAAHPQLPRRIDPSRIKFPAFVRRTLEFDAPQWSRLKSHCMRVGLTPTAMLAAAYAEILSLWGAADRFTLNMTVANRLEIHPDINQVIGNFTDCLLLSVEVDARASFRQQALDLQAGLREAIDHRQFSGIEVMRALGRRQGSAQAVPMPFTFNSTIGAGEDGSSIALFGRETFAVSQTPQVWLNLFLLERDGALVVETDAVDEVFPDGLISDLVSAYGRLLTSLATEPAKWEEPSHGLLPVDQVKRRREANQTEAAVPPGQAYSGFLEQVARAPGALAIVTVGRQITYGELAAAAAAVARRLRRQGVKRNDLVGVVMPKGWEEIAAILGVLMAGGAYLPVDANLPGKRIDQLLHDGRVQVFVTRGDVPATTGAGFARLVIDDGFLTYDPETGSLDHDLPEAAQTDLAYVIYTSGSTGAPKGVMISHHGVVNLVADITRRFGVGPEDRLFAISKTGFDLSVFDIFGALWNGAALVIPDGNAETDPAKWLAQATRSVVTIWNSVPAVVAALVEQAAAAGQPLPPQLRLIMMSGDRIPVSLPSRLMSLKADLRIVALGGPTETTVWNIVYPIDRVDPAWANIPYGKPTANNRYYVLDAFLRECPDHVPGELYAAGAGLAAGYWCNPELTSASFVRHAQLDERLYRTGDVGRYLSDGNIEILGRADFQIKLNGYRIEPGEIETLLNGDPAIAESAVVLRTSEEGPHLAAFVVCAEKDALNAELEARLRTQLAAALPDYMVPRRFVWLAQLPLTANGKVDRRRLQDEADEAPPQAETPVEAAETELEQRLMTIWSDILKTSTIKAVSKFYRLGGTSLLAVRLLARVRKEFNVSVPLADLPQHESPRAMARHIERQIAMREAS
ncbi:amino acid adenylation domain-containing protein [uncultured Bradyrhizobium sp.]|uniref:non-ribosomal peptide synthetase n=1 Tax=uncultured Bradyrhizobium sp. TaxID=199684 RepID=UPI0035CC9EA1